MRISFTATFAGGITPDRISTDGGMPGNNRSFEDTPRKAGLCALIIILSILAIGTLGYRYIEDWSWFQSFYMTLITITTIGYSEPADISHTGRIFTSVLIFMGVLGFGFALAVMGQSQIESFFRRRRKLMKKRIDALENHIIVCGAGNTGRLLLKEVGDNQVTLLFIELNEDIVQDMQEAGRFVIHGDATEENSLLNAGIRKARSLITTLPSDADNLYITMAARELNPDIRIVAKAHTLAAERRLRKSGANHVAMPEKIGARNMMIGAIRPMFVDFISSISTAEASKFAMEQFWVPHKSPIAGRTIVQAFHKKFNIMIVAIQRKDGEMIIKPGPEDTIQEEDFIMVLGAVKDLRVIEEEAGLSLGIKAPVH
jgi:voltage-gated potassium channel